MQKSIQIHNVWKSAKKVAFNIAREASYVLILIGQKLIKNAKKWSIWRVFEHLKRAVKQWYQTAQFDNFYATLLTIFSQSYMFRIFVKKFWAQDFWNYFQTLWYRNSVQCATLHLPRTHVALRSLYFGGIRK